MALSIPTGDGLAYLYVDDYIKAYKEARHTFEKAYLDQENEVHLFDIFDNFFEDYSKNEGVDNMVLIKLSVMEKNMYRYNPKLLSKKIYDTPNYWPIILIANGLVHPGQFDLVKPLKLPTIESLEAFFNRGESIRESIGGYWMDLKDLDIFRK